MWAMTEDDPPPRSDRPLHDLILQLPLLPVTALQDIDYPAADPALLVQLADNAWAVLDTLLSGMSAIGYLLARGAPDETRIPDPTESMGHLLAELGDLASVAHSLSIACRRHTADYAPASQRVIPNAKL
jgi:hypothetical protein